MRDSAGWGPRGRPAITFGCECSGATRSSPLRTYQPTARDRRSSARSLSRCSTTSRSCGTPRRAVSRARLLPLQSPVSSPTVPPPHWLRRALAPEKDGKIAHCFQEGKFTLANRVGCWCAAYAETSTALSRRWLAAPAGDSQRLTPHPSHHPPPRPKVRQVEALHRHRLLHGPPLDGGHGGHLRGREAPQPPEPHQGGVHWGVPPRDQRQHPLPGAGRGSGPSNPPRSLPCRWRALLAASLISQGAQSHPLHHAPDCQRDRGAALQVPPAGGRAHRQRRRPHGARARPSPSPLPLARARTNRSARRRMRPRRGAAEDSQLASRHRRGTTSPGHACGCWRPRSSAASSRRCDERAAAGHGASSWCRRRPRCFVAVAAAVAFARGDNNKTGTGGRLALFPRPGHRQREHTPPRLRFEGPV